MVAVATMAWPGGAVAAPTATVTGLFGDSCRIVNIVSSKDISHVEIRYADGRVVKDEIIDSPDYSLHGTLATRWSSSL